MAGAPAPFPNCMVHARTPACMVVRACLTTVGVLSTTTASIIANQKSMTWETKNGQKQANYFGSLTQASTSRLGGHGPSAVDAYIPFSSMLPMVHPNDLVVGGWDISSMNLADAMKRAKVRTLPQLGFTRCSATHCAELMGLASFVDPLCLATPSRMLGLVVL